MATQVPKHSQKDSYLHIKPLLYKCPLKQNFQVKVLSVWFESEISYDFKQN